MLFCQISPLTYRLSIARCRMKRRISDALSRQKFASAHAETPLPTLIYAHDSLIRRRLGNVDMTLQENKAVNLSIAAPHIHSILIRPGETFSFWRLVGAITPRRGYREGLIIRGGQPDSGIGGGLCQMTNLIHWMALHSSLTILEHHHHDGVDLFPDHGRKVPFGTGTSVFYNYIDYRLRNDTDAAYQLFLWVDGEYLRGELRREKPQEVKYHIRVEGEGFIRKGNEVYRIGKVWRDGIDPRTGNTISHELIRENYALVKYAVQ